MNKALKSVEKVLSGTHCKLCLCVLLVGMILYILNRFTFGGRNEGFLNAFSMDRQNGLSNRAENEYRRVKLKYGKKKLRKMGLDPEKYSEDFIFALKIKLGEVHAEVKAVGHLVTSQYIDTYTGAPTLKDLQGKLTKEDTPVDITLTPMVSASINVARIIVGVSFVPSGSGDADQKAPGFKDALKLYGQPDTNLTFLCNWHPGVDKQTIIGHTGTSDANQLIRTDFPQIHGFRTAATSCLEDVANTINSSGKSLQKAGGNCVSECKSSDVTAPCSTKSIGVDFGVYQSNTASYIPAKEVLNSHVERLVDSANSLHNWIVAGKASYWSTLPKVHGGSSSANITTVTGTAAAPPTSVKGAVTTSPPVVTAHPGSGKNEAYRRVLTDINILGGTGAMSSAPDAMAILLYDIALDQKVVDAFKINDIAVVLEVLA